MEKMNLVFSKKILAAGIVFVFIAASAFSQTVISSAKSSEDDVPAAAKTLEPVTIILNAKDGISTDIFKITEYGSDTFLCATPAEFTLDTNMKFSAGRLGYFEPGCKFSIDVAKGGTQIYSVRAPNKTKFMIGFGLMMGGSILASSGTLIGLIYDIPAVSIAFAAVSVGCISVGVPMFLKSRAKVTLLEIKF